MKPIPTKRITGVMRIINAVLVFLLVVNVAFVVSAKRQAQAGFGNPFGGMSSSVFYCTCSSNIAVTINDLTIGSSNPSPLRIIYQPGATILYPFGQIYRPGVWTLGLWNAGGSCMYYVGKGCSTYTTDGIMYMVGTSL